MSLPPFSLNFRVSAETAKQDRIHADIGEWTLEGSTENIDALRNRMGSLLEAARPNAPIEALDEWGRLFLRPQQRGGFRAALAVRKQPLIIGAHVIDPPLFSGRWVFSSYVRRDISVTTKTKTHLELWLNPTRYVRHQPHSPFPNPMRRGSWPEAQMFGSRLAPQINGEVSLDGGDNWLSSSSRWNAFTNPARWRQHLMTYLFAVPSIFEEELNRLSQVEGDCSFSTEPSLCLHLVETYWEFASDNPTILVLSLKPLLQAFSRRYREARVYPHELTESLDHNALLLTAQITAGKELRIYAKTNKRVRIEVIHTMGGRDGFRLRRGHTAGDWERFPEMLHALAEDAATLVNRAFEFFETQNNVAPSHIPAFQLLLEICEHCRDMPTAITIASLLVANNTIAAGQTNEAMRGSLHALSAAGILEHTGEQSQTYVVSESRRHALRTLQQHDNFTLLTARVRRRIAS